MIAAIPLGGYVKMLDEREGDVAPADSRTRLQPQTGLQRIAIAAAGPRLRTSFSAVARSGLMFVIGSPDYAPVVGRRDRARRAGRFSAGDRILAVRRPKSRTWTEATIALAPRRSGRGAPCRCAMRTAAGADRCARSRSIALPPRHSMNSAAHDRHGSSRRPCRRRRQVCSGMPAAAAGLQDGDRILAIDGTAGRGFRSRSAPLVQRDAAKSPRLGFEVERDGDRIWR